jgi:hypothetical protein
MEDVGSPYRSQCTFGLTVQQMVSASHCRCLRTRLLRNGEISGPRFIGRPASGRGVPYGQLLVNILPCFIGLGLGTIRTRLGPTAR